MGTTGAQFLSQGEGARALALGDAFTALADDPSALFWNPAGLARLQSPQLLLTHSFGLENTSNDFFGFAQPLDLFSVGLGVNYSSMPAMDRLSEFGETLGSFAPYDLTLQAAGSLSWSGVSAGLTLQYFRQDLGDASVQGMALNAGAKIPLISNRLLLGFALQNLGPPMTFVRQSAPLPWGIRLGGCFQLMPDWILAGEISLPSDNRPALHAGAEYQIRLSPSLAISPRLGMKSSPAYEADGLSGFSCGLGFQWAEYSLDYAWLPSGALGAIHRLALGMRWNAAGTPPTVVPQAAPEPAAAVPEPEKPVEVEPAPESNPAPKPANSKPADPRSRTSETEKKPELKEEIEAAPVAPVPEDYPRWAGYYLNKARAYFTRGKYYTASTYCEQALKWQEDLPGLKELAGQIKARLAGQPKTGTDTP